jgi:HlyD family secretion protein
LRFRPPPELSPDGAAAKPARPSGGHAGGAWKRPAEDDKKSVWLMQPAPALPKQIQVKTGVTDGTNTELVEGGLKEGDLLVTDVSSTGKDGAKPAGMGMPGGAPGGRRGM